MSIVIDDPVVTRKVEELAAHDGVSAGRAAELLLASALAAPPMPGARLHGEAFRQAVAEIQQEIAAIPDASPSYTEDDLYDENGAPA